MHWEDVFHGEAGTGLVSSFGTASPLPGQKAGQKLSEKTGERLTPFRLEKDQDFLLLSSLQGTTLLAWRMAGLHFGSQTLGSQKTPSQLG